MPSLYANPGSGNQKLKALYANPGTGNVKLKELWARGADGYNKKIYVSGVTVSFHNGATSVYSGWEYYQDFANYSTSTNLDIWGHISGSSSNATLGYMAIFVKLPDAAVNTNPTNTPIFSCNGNANITVTGNGYCQSIRMQVGSYIGDTTGGNIESAELFMANNAAGLSGTVGVSGTVKTSDAWNSIYGTGTGYLMGFLVYMQALQDNSLQVRVSIPWEAFTYIPTGQVLLYS
jgi:hypothetical protein